MRKFDFKKKKEIEAKKEATSTSCEPYQFTLFVGNLPQECKKQHLLEYLKEETDITNVVLKSNTIRLNGHSKILKYAFVTFSVSKCPTTINEKYSSELFLNGEPLKFEQVTPAEKSAPGSQTGTLPRATNDRTQLNGTTITEIANSTATTTDAEGNTSAQTNEISDSNFSTTTTISGEQPLEEAVVEILETTKNKKKRSEKQTRIKQYQQQIVVPVAPKNAIKDVPNPLGEKIPELFEDSENNMPQDDTGLSETFPRSQNTLFVSNLPFAIRKDELSSFFSVEESCIHLPMRRLQDLQTGRIILSETKNRGFTFVTYNKFGENESIDTKAKLLSGLSLGNRKLRAQVATEKKKNTTGIATSIISMTNI